MEQQGFLGTIGYIKANLMSSPALQDKNYSNENFYPGAENIPDSEPSISFPFKKIGNIVVDENFVASGFSKSNYIELGNMPDFPEYFECGITFSSTKKYNSGSSTTWYTMLLCPSATNSSRTRNGLMMRVKGRQSNAGAEAVICNTSGSSWGVYGSDNDTTNLKCSMNNKYTLIARREASTSGFPVQMNLSLFNSNGDLIAQEISKGSGAVPTQLVNLSNHVLGVGDGSARTFFDGGSIYLKECYFKAL